VRHPRLVVPGLLAAGALVLSTLTAQAAAPRHPDTGLRLFSPNHHVVMTVHTFPGEPGEPEEQWVEFNPAIYLGSRTSQFEIDVKRANASKPITAQVRIGHRVRKLPTRLLDGWNGLKDAFTITWRTPAGQAVAQSRQSWCPNDGTPSRLGPHAATETAFTYGCSSHPFTRGMRWGIDRGWARQIPTYDIATPPASVGDHAILEVTLRWALAKRFGLTDAQRRLRFDVAVKHVVEEEEGDGGEPQPPPVGRIAPGVVGGSSRIAHHEPPAPQGTHGKRPAAGVLPDLISLPAFGISTHNEDGRDLLDFAATVYNGGPGPLVAEGFRPNSKPLMKAYQFFYRGEKQVAARRVGGMEYDKRPSHSHWHFQDFAVYDLVNKKHKRLRTSGKEAFCLAPTDAINLLGRGAVVDPGNGDLSTACGEEASVWVREVLASGWGDTYSQQRAGQSIDVTGLPNGSYWIRVTANPVHRLFETTRRNNVSLRRVILGGTAGDRTVRVPKYGLINSETYFGDEDGGHRLG
jgi:hypothetical protein